MPKTTLKDPKEAGTAIAATPKPAAKRKAPKPKAPKSPAQPVQDDSGLDDLDVSSPGNGKKLVIVESPAKAKTINKYLGNEYVVKASMGHVRDLPSKGMGVDLESFEPQYEVLEDRESLISELRKLAKKSSEIYLATDLDREGEAIAWHLKEALKIPDNKARRVIFNAITKSEIQKAFAKPMAIDIDRVNAQQARRILDRIVGYEISPILWKKVARGLSAGRVQSVAVRLVVEREREIEAFTPAEFWKIGALFTVDQSKMASLANDWTQFLATDPAADRTKAQKDQWLTQMSVFTAELVEFDGKKFDVSDRAVALKIAQALGFNLAKETATDDPQAKGPAKSLVKYFGGINPIARFNVTGIEKKRTTSRPSAPFITSTLQQGASTRLGLGAQRTMRIAQGLYEAGHITYMRTDSTNLSAEALNIARAYVEKEFGPKYLPAKPNLYASSNKSAQEAHEAIRPTDVNFTPALAHKQLSTDEYKVYQLIWNRFVACQMPPAEFDQTTATILSSTSAGPAVFRASGRKLVFDGFMRVAGISSDDQLLPELAEKQPVFPIQIDPTQHFTQPPPRFSEASLVKELERLGIGRPSTYASIIQTIQDREYVEQVDRRFHATMLGSIVTDKLIQGFPEIMDVKFTAEMELKLDQIEEQHLDWQKLLHDFYGPFHDGVDSALGRLEHAGGTPSPYTCDKCGKPMVYRISKNGFFLSCTGYPECDGTKPVDLQGKPTIREVSPYKCPVCGKEMIRREARFGEFLGCSGYPECKTKINIDKKTGNPKPQPVQTPLKCEKCGNPLLLRNGARGAFLGCSGFPGCRAGIKSVKKLEGEDAKIIEALLPQLTANADAAAATGAKIGLTPPPPRPKPAATDIACDQCGKPMIIRQGRRGPFLGCSGYPKCKNTGEVPASLMESLGLTNKETPAAKTPPKELPEEIDADLTIE